MVSKRCVHYRKLKNLPKRTCEVCGKSLVLTKTREITTKRFCSRHCRAIYACEAAMKVNRLKSKRTSIEIKMAELLTKLGVEFQEQKIIANCKCMPDFYLPKYNTCIMADGTYWHSGAKKQYRDARINKRLMQAGYGVIRYDEQDINKNINWIASDIRTNLKLF